MSPFNRPVNLVAVVVAAALLLPTPAVRAEDNRLEDPTGNLVVTVPSSWRKQESPHPIAASGFLGIKRAELFGALYETQDASTAIAEWKKAREAEGGSPAFAEAEGDHRWTAHSETAGTVDYVRGMTGAGRSAVVWLRVSGSPGTVAEKSWALVNGAVLGKKKETPKATVGDGSSGEKPEGVVLKDKDYRVEIPLPAGFAERKKVELGRLRVLSAKGPVGSDKGAFLDLYMFDSFRRIDAAAYWWQEKERRGWDRPARISGDLTDFTVEIEGETWTRRVRLLATDAGVLGIKLDVESKAEKAAVAFMNQLVKDLKVLKVRPKIAPPPTGMKTDAGESHVVYYGGTTDSGGSVETLRGLAANVDKFVGEKLGLDPFEGRLGVFVVHADSAGLAASLRPQGVTDGRAAHWNPDRGVVETYAGVTEDEDSRAVLRSVLAADAVHRRFGYRVPWWLEHGMALVVSTGAYSKGRTDVPHPKLIEGARNAAGGSVEFEVARWWTEENSRLNPERLAVVWSFVYLFAHGGQLAKTYEEPFVEYVKRLRSSGDVNKANGAFGFDREAAFVDHWKKWVRKL